MHSYIQREPADEEEEGFSSSGELDENDNEEKKGANLSLSGNLRASDLGRFQAVDSVPRKNLHPNDGHEEMKTDDQEEGEYTFENGAVYNGQWQGRMRHGFGEQSWPDGARYEGEWLENKAHGRGVFYHVDGDVFDGEWYQDKAHGFGTYFNVNGSKYEGYW